jgi:hypothetical protein
LIETSLLPHPCGKGSITRVTGLFQSDTHFAAQRAAKWVSAKTRQNNFQYDKHEKAACAALAFRSAYAERVLPDRFTPAA